jgi:protein O-mannosyl-transferase
LKPDRRWAAACAALTLLFFLPTVRFPFLDWDDKANLLLNQDFRGFSPANLRWMFTTHYRGPYQPLSWLSLALDHQLWGLEPAGYHLVNAALHAASAALAYLVARAFLGRPAAAFAALFFSLHPLRVESVAWVTERRDVLSGFFFLLALLGHVRGTRRGLVLAAFTAACLAKATAVGLVWALVAVDYARARKLVLEDKGPFFAVALVVGLVNLRGFVTGDLAVARYGPLQRLSIAGHAAFFYARKTLWPAGLSPYYALPLRLRPIAPMLTTHTLAALAVTAAAFDVRRRWPGVAAAWFSYLLILAPVSGLLQNGQQLAADRYSYLACLPLAALAGAAFERLARTPRARGALAAAVLTVFGAFSLRQMSFWRDDVALWTRAVSLDPDNYLARSNLATEYFLRRRYQDALVHYQQAIRLEPRDYEARLNVGAIWERRGMLQAARMSYESVLALNPGNLEARNNLAVLLIKQGRRAQADAALEAIVREAPSFAPARENLERLRALSESAPIPGRR